MAEPPAKRPRTTLAPSTAASSSSLPGSRMLHHTVLAMLFLVRVGGRGTDAVTASFSRIGRVVQAHVDRAMHRYHDMIFSKLESFQEQIQGLHSEVRQLGRVCASNRYADEQTRKRPQLEHATTTAEGPRSSNRTSNNNTRLSFRNALKPPVYTNKDLRTADDDDNAAGIKVALLEGDGDGTVVVSGPLSGARIEVLVLRGDFFPNPNDPRGEWTEEEFESHVVRGRDGKKLVLATAWLTHGEVELRGIRFTEGSCRTPSRTFILAARVCRSEKTDDVLVREAVMAEPVKVLDRRNEPNRKSHPPRLRDEVYRLEKIAKDGDYHKRLEDARIFTVEDFLKALNRDPVNLCDKVLQMKRKPDSWSKLTKHARQRDLEDRQAELKPYYSSDGSAYLLFNCVHDLVGGVFSGQYVASEHFESHHKVQANELKQQAYSVLDQIPSGYVMRGNIPEPIATATAEFPHRDEINNNQVEVEVARPSFPTAANCDTSAPVDLVTAPYFYQGTHPQQQQTGILPQQNPRCPMLQASYPFQTQMFRQDGSSEGASTSSSHQPNIEPTSHLTMPITAQAWTPPQPQQPWNDEQDPQSSVFPAGSSDYMNH